MSPRPGGPPRDRALTRRRNPLPEIAGEGVAGLERVTLGARRRGAFRWWYFVNVPGFAFARGGRADTAADAQAEIDAAYHQALAERDEYRHRPTHQLGPGGQLIPLDARPELKETT